MAKNHRQGSPPVDPHLSSIQPPPGLEIPSPPGLEAVGADVLPLYSGDRPVPLPLPAPSDGAYFDAWWLRRGSLALSRYPAQSPQNHRASAASASAGESDMRHALSSGGNGMRKAISAQHHRTSTASASATESHVRQFRLSSGDADMLKAISAASTTRTSVGSAVYSGLDSGGEDVRKINSSGSSDGRGRSSNDRYRMPSDCSDEELRQRVLSNCTEDSFVLVSKYSDDEEEAVLERGEPKVFEQTTVILRNIPEEYTRQDLLDLLDRQGFQWSYDFLFLPAELKTGRNWCYAFVNLVSGAWARRLSAHFQNFADWGVPSPKICKAEFSDTQSLWPNVERYRNSPIMHPEVPDEFKPMFFVDGVRRPFPPPTAPVRRPRGKRREPLAP